MICYPGIRLSGVSAVRPELAFQIHVNESLYGVIFHVHERLGREDKSRDRVSVLDRVFCDRSEPPVLAGLRISSAGTNDECTLRVLYE